MNRDSLVDIRPDVRAALSAGRPVVALESALITHGLPWPVNFETAQQAEQAIRDEGVTPATIAVLAGRPTIGLSESEVRSLAHDSASLKASRRDLAFAIACKQTAGTTVAATIFLAAPWTRMLATGGIGGVHRGENAGWDISADLTELARTQIGVVCSGAKSILDLPRTLELLETLSIPVIGYGCDTLPAFYVRSSELPLSARVDTPGEAAEVLQSHLAWQGDGLLFVQPVPEDVALSAVEMQEALEEAERRAKSANIRGNALTPFLLSALAEITHGRTLQSNQALVVANARLAAKIAKA